MEGYPVRFWADYPESSSRGILLLRTFLGPIILIPHYFLLYFLAIAYAFVTFIAWWAILFTGQFPKGMFDFSVKFNRYQQWINGYLMMLCDQYPPFFGEAEPGADYPIHFEADYPETSSRGILLLRTFLGYIYVLIPHGFCMAFLGIAMAFVLFIAWWAILFTGQFPRGMFDFVVGVTRWNARVTAYMTMLTDEYPPFSLD
jgi:hypothetical protein